MRRLLVTLGALALWLGLVGTSVAQGDSAATGQFSPAGSLGEARVGHTATLVSDGRVLVVGGWDRFSGPDSLVASAAVWDPDTATFIPAGSLAEARAGHTATRLLDGRVLVVGGWDSLYEPDSNLASAEVWDPATATFSPAGSLAQTRYLHSATLLPDGRILVIGGIGGDDALATAEVWDPATASFSPAGSLAVARLDHSATLLPDGRVLVVGGTAGWDQDSLASAEVWDPTTASFSPAGWLLEERALHSATLLPGGPVLVVGGRDTDGVLASAEVWEPSDWSQPSGRPEASPAPETTAVPEATDRQPALADPALEAQFPDAVSGEPLAVEWRSGQAFVDDLPEGVAALAEGLVEEQGKTLDDVTVAMASSTQGSILGMRLAGGDAMAFFGPLLAGMFTGDPYAEWMSIQVAGKDVMTIPFGSGSVYARPQGEVVWGVSAEEPALTEIFTALP